MANLRRVPVAINRRSADLEIEERAGGIEASMRSLGLGRRVHARRRGIGAGVDDVERVDVVVVLDPRTQRSLDRHVRDGDELPGEEAGGDLPLDALERQRTISTDAASAAHGEGVAELGLVEDVGRARREALGPDVGGRAAHESGVRCSVIVLVDPGQNADVDVVE